MYDIEQIKIDEGFRSKPYHCTAGKLTIGYGINLDEGITEEEAEAILEIRLENLWDELGCFKIKIFGQRDYGLNYELARKGYLADEILVNMAYNLGIPRLARFKNMWAALEEFDYHTAAAEMKDSMWYVQTGDRAERLVARMEALS